MPVRRCAQCSTERHAAQILLAGTMLCAVLRWLRENVQTLRAKQKLNRDAGETVHAFLRESHAHRCRPTAHWWTEPARRQSPQKLRGARSRLTLHLRFPRARPATASAHADGDTSTIFDVRRGSTPQRYR